MRATTQPTRLRSLITSVLLALTCLSCASTVQRPSAEEQQTTAASSPPEPETAQTPARQNELQCPGDRIGVDYQPAEEAAGYPSAEEAAQQGLAGAALSARELELGDSSREQSLFLSRSDDGKVTARVRVIQLSSGGWEALSVEACPEP